MSEDKRKDPNVNNLERTLELYKASRAESGSSRTVTSDAQNSASVYAGRTRITSKAEPEDAGSWEDDILELIRKRKGVSADSTDSTDLASDDDDFFRLFDELDAAEAAQNTGSVNIPDRTIEVNAGDMSPEISVTDKTIEVTSHEPQDPVVTDKTIEVTAPQEPAAADVSDKTIEIEAPVNKTEADVKKDAEDESEAVYAAVIPSISDDKKEDKAESDTQADVSEADNSADAAAESELSELEKELSEHSSKKNADRRTDKRYGFKPYTRELQAEEIKHLLELSKESEMNAGAAAGAVGKMAKGTGKKQKNSQGASKASKSDNKAKSSGTTSKSKPKSQTKGGQSSRSSGSGGGGGGKKKKKPKKWVGFVRAFVRTIVICGIIAVLAAAGYAANIISHADTIHPKAIYDTLDVSTHIYDDQENLVDEIYYSENRQIVSYEQLPVNLQNAFIAVEDKTFWTHKGFNFKRIIGAILERFHGGRISGTSTITQQLARNVFLPEDKSVRSIKRKIIEMYYAYQIEQELSKEEILTAYLNTIYLGYGCYGVDTAAKTYFSTDVENLTLEQCAALAALPQAPGTYSLLVTEEGENTVEYKNGVYINDASQDRRNMILNMMLQQGMITEEEKEAATKPLADFIKPGSTDSATSQSAFKDYLIETVKKDLMNEYGIEEDQAIKIIYTKGLNIYTTMDSQAQKAVTEQFKKKKNFPSTSNGKGTVESACVVCEVGTGEIKAMVGTRNATGQMLFNRAVNPRQPGSSIKPLSVYAPALQKSYEYQKDGKTFKFKKTGYDKQGTGGWGDYITVSSTVTDEKMTVNGKTWPLNVTRSYTGYNTFRTAIQKSINTCSVKILSQIGIEYSMDTLKRFGITSAIDDSSQSVNDLNLAALGLGAMSYGISPLEMAEAYAAFPNGGVVNTPIIYTKVEDSSGRTLLEGKSQTTKVLDEGVAWIMTDVLKSVVSKGIAKPAAVKGITVGGKTGTTDDRYDIWFNGFTPSYSIALWIGTDDNVQMDSASEKAAALWSKVVSKIDRAKKGEYKDRPDNVIRAWNGEYYTKGTAPPEPPPEPDPEEEKEKAEEAAKKAAQEQAAKALEQIVNGKPDD